MEASPSAVSSASWRKHWRGPGRSRAPPICRAPWGGPGSPPSALYPPVLALTRRSGRDPEPARLFSPPPLLLLPSPAVAHHRCPASKILLLLPQQSPELLRLRPGSAGMGACLERLAPAQPWPKDLQPRATSRPPTHPLGLLRSRRLLSPVCNLWESILAEISRAILI